MKIVSLFSGAGGLDLGLKQSGHEIVWANDIFLDAVETYRLNIGDHVDTRDICDVPESDIPDCDVVVGGFPCQGFSVANWARSMTDPRNQLYRELIRVIGAKKPKYFIAENVKGLVSMERGAVLAKIVSEFEDLGYSVRYSVLNAADYGVPQARMRLIILGERRDIETRLSFPPAPTHADPSKGICDGRKRWFTVGEALAQYPEPGPNTAHIPNHTASQYKLRFNGHIGHRYIDPNRPAPTVTARGDDKGGVVVLHHPKNHRRMTARELASVQSFPSDFAFYGTRTSAYRQIANAVPPLLGAALGQMLRQAEQVAKQDIAA